MNKKKVLEMLEELHSDIVSPIDSYDRNGASFTSPNGYEYEPTSFVLEKMWELAESVNKIREEISK